MSTDPARPDSAPARTVDRRTITKGIAWSVPAVAVASAAPAIAASPPGCPGTVAMNPQPVSGTQVLTAAASGGTCSMTLTVTNSLTGCAPDRNMTIGNTGTMIAGQNSCGYTTYSTPRTGLIVQNAPCACYRNEGSIFAPYAAVPSSTAASSQDITFTFSQPVANLRIEVADISSARPNGGWVPGYVGNYYDHVGFNIAPTTIERDILGSRLGDSGIGSGTFTDPFRRRNTDAQSISDGPFSDVFGFGPSTRTSVTMRYNNGPASNGIKGTQAIFIPAITFDMPCDC